MAPRIASDCRLVVLMTVLDVPKQLRVFWQRDLVRSGLTEDAL